MIKRDIVIEIGATLTSKLRLDVGDRPEIKPNNKAASAPRGNKKTVGCSLELCRSVSPLRHRQPK